MTLGKQWREDKAGIAKNHLLYERDREREREGEQYNKK
jgi:hypothetical protein